MNKAAKLGVGLDEDDTSYIDKHCYKVLQGMDLPCSFCTNKLLSTEKSFISHHKNLNNGKEYVLKDRIVNWHGRKCRMEMAVDISDAEHRFFLTVMILRTRWYPVLHRFLQEESIP